MADIEEPRTAAPAMWTLAEVMTITRLGRTKVEELVASGELPSKKLGARRMVLDVDLRSWIASLPSGVS
jgi:hypothetical protein